MFCSISLLIFKLEKYIIYQNNANDMRIPQDLTVLLQLPQNASYGLGGQSTFLIATPYFSECQLQTTFSNRWQLITSKTGFTTTSRNQSILGPEVKQKPFFKKFKKSSKKLKKFKKAQKVKKVQKSSKKVQKIS